MVTEEVFLLASIGLFSVFICPSSGKAPFFLTFSGFLKAGRKRMFLVLELAGSLSRIFLFILFIH